MRLQKINAGEAILFWRAIKKAGPRTQRQRKKLLIGSTHKNEAGSLDFEIILSIFQKIMDRCSYPDLFSEVT